MEIFEIILPAIPSAGLYFFTTTSGVRYEVRFGRKKDNILHVTIVFGVINDEYEGEEYVVTNKGEIYSVMATIAKIVRIFIAKHPNVMIYEFTGLERKGEDKENAARINLYKRYFPVVFPSSEEWEFSVKGNTALVTREEKILCYLYFFPARG
ncbi:MAG: hypothetical protein V1781_01675 [Bacteroidota bacterium]